MAVQFSDKSALSGAGGLVREEVRAWKMQWSKAGQGCWIFPDVSKTRGASVPHPDDTRAL